MKITRLETQLYQFAFYLVTFVAQLSKLERLEPR